MNNRTMIGTLQITVQYYIKDIENIIKTTGFTYIYQ
jgi:hypothetical protein